MDDTQWRSQGGAHWGTGPTNLVLCPTKLLFSKSLKIATATLFKEEICYILYNIPEPFMILHQLV